MAPKSWLDKLPADVRHQILMLAASLLGWATTSIPALHLPGLVGAVAGPLLTQATLYLTTLTRQYGRGKQS